MSQSLRYKSTSNKSWHKTPPKTVITSKKPFSHIPKGLEPNFSRPPPPFERFKVPPPAIQPPTIVGPPTCKAASNRQPPRTQNTGSEPNWLINQRKPHFYYSRAYIEYVRKFREGDFPHLLEIAKRAAHSQLLNAIKPETLYQFKFMLAIWEKVVATLKAIPEPSHQQQIHLGLLTESNYTHHLALFTIEHIQACVDCAIRSIDKILNQSYDFVSQCMHLHGVTLADIKITKQPQSQVLRLDKAEWRLNAQP